MDRLRMRQTVGRRGPRDRHGMALVFVLGLLAIALALSYTMLRTQSTTFQVRSNVSRRSDARQAAYAGMSAALRKIHDSSWAGVDVDLTGTLSTTESYEVTFTTGDDSLSAGEVDWDDYPYRLTMISTGTATDPIDSSFKTTHRVKTVVQLIPRKISDDPLNWSNLDGLTVHQWGTTDVEVELPFRLEGESHFRGPLRLFDTYQFKSKPFDGVIDEVALYDRVLSDTEISTIYLAGSDPGSGVLSSLYSARNPISWWRFDDTAGATTAVDNQGANHGTYVGADAGAKTGIYNSGVSLDGVNDYVDVGKIDISGSQLTILAWIKPDSFGYSDARIISKATSPSNADHYWMLSTWDSSGSSRLRFRLKAAGTTTELIASSGNLNANQWNFAAATYDGIAMRLYLNGALVGTTSKSGTIDTNPDVFAYIGDNPPGSTRARYLRDLEAMHQADVADYRPFDGPIKLPLSINATEDIDLLSDELNLTLNDTIAYSVTPYPHPGVVSSYQLYTGGKSYSTTVLNSWSLSNTTLQPDVLTNPLGIFYRWGGLTLNDDVTIQGTVILNGTSSSPTMVLAGDNITLLPAEIPMLEGASQSVEIPVALIKDDLQVDGGSTSTVSGLVAVWDEYEVERGADTTAHDLSGKLLTDTFIVGPRTGWTNDEDWWRNLANSFLAQLNGANSVEYYPQWVEQQQSKPVAPAIKIAPAVSPVTYHWQDWTKPLFVAHSNDNGLVWDLIEWTDNY